VQNFESEPPSFPTPEVAPLRTRDATTLAAAVAALKPPFSDALRAELIVLALAHQDPTVKKKAAAQGKHVPELAAWKTAKALSGSQQHQIDEKFAPFEHPLKLAVARALLFHRYAGVAYLFENDPQTRGGLLDLLVDHAKREGEPILELDTIYWYWREHGGWSSYIHIAQWPKGLTAEITARRAKYPFTGIRLHGCNLTDLPDELAEAGAWLESLDLAYNPFTAWPQVLAKLPKLAKLTIYGTPFEDLPDDITELAALRSLDIGNMKVMKEIPQSVCKLDKLAWLRIGNGSIRKIPDELVNMTGLEEIELQSTQVSKLPAGMAKMPNLKKVNLRWSKVKEAQIAELKAAGIEVELD